MERFYVLVDDNNFIKCDTEQEAEDYALEFYKSDRVSIVEYGVINYCGWNGLSTIAVLRKKNSKYD